MENSVFNGSANITGEGIKKHFKSYDPIRSIFELIWNGFDANATIVNVNTIYNDCTVLDSVEVIDNGDGIDIKNINNNFEKFNDSNKKYHLDKHGSQGRGRLSFYRLSDTANWFTKRDNYNAKIIIHSSNIRNFKGSYLNDEEQHISLSNLKSGTCVQLLDIGKNKLPDETNMRNYFKNEFGWLLALNKTLKIYINNKELTVPDHEITETEFNIEEHKFNARIIRWINKPTSEKSYNYIINDNNRMVNKELSKFNNKTGFYLSSYIFSDWNNRYNPQIIEMDPEYDNLKKTYRAIMKALQPFQKVIYTEFLRSHAATEIERFDSEGYFPNYNGVQKNYAEWRKSNTKAIIKEIYIADPAVFSKLNPKQSKILIRLLDKILVSNENDSLLDILESVLDLDQKHLNSLNNQLNKTTLENIISTTEALQKRQFAINKMREIMEYRYKDVLETPDLQKIIENNTWLFGPQYTTLGAEEDTFTSIAKKLRDEIKDINIVTEDDIFDGIDVIGVNRQVDLFLARKIPSFNSSYQQCYKCVIIEIKRPGISLNKKHLQQLEDYAEIISKHPAFSSSKMIFELILIGRKISKDDYYINDRIANLKDKGELGLVSTGRIKCYVKDWFTIFDEFELTNNYLLSTLRTKFDSITENTTDEIVLELQTEKV